MPLGSQVKKYRNATGCTYADVEAMCGVSTGNINAIEKRNSGRSEHAPALARAFGLSTDELLDEETDYSDRARAAVAQWRITRTHPTSSFKAAEPANSWAGSIWPFSITRERMNSTLEAGDIKLIDAFIVALIQSRETLQGKQEPRQGNGAP